MSISYNIIALSLSTLPVSAQRLSKVLFKSQHWSSPPHFFEFCIEKFPLLNASVDFSYNIIESCTKLDISLLNFFESDFPLSESTVTDCPLILFYKGNIKNCLNNKLTLGIVGSRNADLQALNFTKLLALKVSKSSTIISGLALGIDSSAHQGALDAKCRSNNIAVLAHGLDQIYPKQNVKIAQNILADGGALISQYAPGVSPRPQNFLIRNALIAGLSHAIIVIQAGERSGSLVTARLALEKGKDVIAVPGSIFDLRSAGTNKLIQQGAHLLANLDDIYNLIPELEKVDQLSETGNSVSMSEQVKKIINSLKSAGKLSYYDLAEVCENSPRLAENLLQLELDGLIRRVSGNAYMWAG